MRSEDDERLLPSPNCNAVTRHEGVCADGGYNPAYSYTGLRILFALFSEERYRIHDMGGLEYNPSMLKDEPV
jgi:hypothetical protein